MSARAAVLCLVLPLTASAHLMVAQHGTLNLVGDGAFLVLSLPASAFPLADDDHDGRLSEAEVAAHQGALVQAIESGVRLLDDVGARPLEGVLLALAPPDDARALPSEQLVALGRFALARPAAPMALSVTLFGEGAAARSEAVTVTRAGRSQLAYFTPQRTRLPLFPSSPAIVADAFSLGALHILEGPDHLLFLLVVLAAGGGWRRVALTLTCFTAGHAVTLGLSLWRGVAVSPAIVEPAIALTIIAVAALDWRRRSTGREGAAWARLAIVFGCALFHGLALAGGLAALGLDRANVLEVLLGFNLGVEAGQLGVTALAAGLTLTLLPLLGRRRLVQAQHLAGIGAIVTGGAWFVQRVLAPG
jgi:hypothetical protein